MMKMMQPNTVSPEVLYNLIVDFKNDVNRRFDAVDDTLKDHKLDIKELKNTQGSVKMKFSSLVLSFHIFVSALISLFITLFLRG